jgi:flagellar biosynthesis component FlhA
MSERQRAVLSIELTLDTRTTALPPFAEVRLAADIEAAVGKLLDELGVPATPRLLLQAPTKMDASFRLTIDGRTLPYPAQVIREVARTLGGDQGSSGRTLFLTAAITASLSEQPKRLITDDIAAAFLLAGGDRCDLDPGLVRKVLEGLLDCGITIGDRSMILRELSLGKQEGEPAVSLVERLIARLRPLVFDVDIHPDYARTIVGDVGRRYVYLQETALTPEARESFGMLTDGIFYELGVKVPPFRFRADPSLPPRSFVCWVNHRRGAPHLGLEPSERLVNDTPDRLRMLNIEGRPALNPANGNECAIIRAGDQSVAERAGLTTWDAVGYLILTLASEIRRNAHCFVDEDVIQAAALDLDSVFPGLATEVVEAESLGRTTAVMRALLREQVSIRDFRAIVDGINTFDLLRANALDTIVLDERLAIDDTAPESLRSSFARLTCARH